MISWSLWIVLWFWSLNVIAILLYVYKNGGYKNMSVEAIFCMMVAFPAPFILLDYVQG